METASWIAFVVLSLAGFAGVLVPGLPGAPLVYAGVVALAWGHGFDRISGWTLLVMGVLTAFMTVLDIVATAIGAKRSGGSRWGVIGAIVGAIVGIFLGPAGIIVGAFAGAIGGELVAGRSSDDAVKAGIGTLVGLVASAVVEGAFCLALVIGALVAHFWR